MTARHRMIELLHVDRPGAEARRFLGARHSATVARRGQLRDACDVPAVVGYRETTVVGVLTYVVLGDECELRTLHVTRAVGPGSAPVWYARRRPRRSRRVARGAGW